MLFSSFSVKNLTLKNRIVMPPMCMYCANLDGTVTDWHVIHYATRAVGQVGLLIVESTAVAPEGRLTNSDLGLWDDRQVDGLKRLVEAVLANGSRIGIQLNHGGRKSHVAGQPLLAPSPIAFNAKYGTPKEMTRDDIKGVVESFAQAASRAVRAGFDLIEIHAAHGYLLSQFLSPLSNQREDEYGGSPANRARLLGEVVEAVQSVLPSGMPLLVRVSAHDFEAGGNTPQDVAEMINTVKHKGIDVVDVSSGAVTETVPRAYPGYQIPFALTIRERTNLPVIGGGLITEPMQALRVVKSGVDLVYIGRELLRNPYWPLKAAYLLGQNIEWPAQYIRGKFPTQLHEN
ncbi:MAG: NADPH dehydrogenase NamA [Firmicutes bacterium]|nr:NADPH dehydrogenase NamA [Bacillota bacterium]